MALLHGKWDESGADMYISRKMFALYYDVLASTLKLCSNCIKPCFLEKYTFLEQMWKEKITEQKTHICKDNNQYEPIFCFKLLFEVSFIQQYLESNNLGDTNVTFVTKKKIKLKQTS